MNVRDTAIQQFHEALSRICDIPAIEWRDFSEFLNVSELEKGGVFVRQGEISQSLAFVVKGLLRKYYIDESGGDYTKLFCMENGFVSSFASFMSGEPSCFGIEALEPTTLITFQHETLKIFLERHSCWLRVYNAALEKFYIIKERREGQLLMQDASTRYEQFKVDYPGLEKRVKQYHIASYLGISPVSLSRISKLKK